MTKIGRNDLCPCNSGIKYKKCCQNNVNNKFLMGQATSSEKIATILDVLRIKYPEHVFIDITDDLSFDNYRQYQLKNFNNNVVMVAEKTLKNAMVFLERSRTSTTDVIIMYRGSYRSFDSNQFTVILESLSTMIVL